MAQYEIEQQNRNQNESQSLLSRISNPLGSMLYGSASMSHPPNGEDDEDDKLSRQPIDFLQDQGSNMTLGRRIAIALSRKYKFYNPRLAKSQEFDESELEPVGASFRISKNGAINSSTDAYPYTHARRENPCIEKAWAYWEHIILPRFVVTKNNDSSYRKVFCKARKKLKRAEPGEKYLETKLYDPFFGTPHSQLGDWGIGFGLYFSTLRFLGMLSLVAGLLNIPNILYFMSDKYTNLNIVSTDKDSGTMVQWPKTFAVFGSAVCPNQQWVPCPDCALQDDQTAWLMNGLDPTRLANGTLDAGTNDSGLAPSFLVFALRNNCEINTTQPGFINYATLFVLIGGIWLLKLYLNRMALFFDEDEQTAQDYSIIIRNPPGNATDPNEWRNFFKDNHFPSTADEDGGGCSGTATASDGVRVTCCTVAVDNDLLVKSLVQRRELLRRIELMVEPGTALDTITLTAISAQHERARTWWQRVLASISPGIPELFARVVVLNAKVQGLSQQDYPATNVFCTFETEEEQRRVRKALNFSKVALNRHNRRLQKAKASTNAANDGEPHECPSSSAFTGVPPPLFRGELLLEVREPGEPCTVRWKDLNEEWIAMCKQQVATMLVTVIALTLIATCVWFLETKVSPYMATLFISFTNTIFPRVAMLLTDCEAHPYEGNRQRSLYVKIALFRWVNTAVLITLFRQFTDVLEPQDGLVAQVFAQFMAEIAFSTLSQLADLPGHLQRHFFAPRERTQDAMNLRFSMGEVELSERYTDMTKIFFLAIWYCAIYPAALLLCSLALFVNYFTDRFSLMRTWKKAPHYGDQVSTFSQGYFFPLSICFMAIFSAFWWSGFPYDNICRNDNVTAGSEYAGTWALTPETDGSTVNVTVSSNEATYRFCSQILLRQESLSFPFLPQDQPPGDEWMSPAQETVTSVYGWSSVGVLTAVVAVLISRIVNCFRDFFYGTYTPHGDDQNIPYSEVASISAYIPQVNSNLYSYPLIACKTEDVDERLFDWTDHDRAYSFYDLTKDAKFLLRGSDISSNCTFSRVAHWLPEDNH